MVQSDQVHVAIFLENILERPNLLRILQSVVVHKWELQLWAVSSIDKIGSVNHAHTLTV